MISPLYSLSANQISNLSVARGFCFLDLCRNFSFFFLVASTILHSNDRFCVAQFYLYSLSHNWTIKTSKGVSWFHLPCPITMMLSIEETNMILSTTIRWQTPSWVTGGRETDTHFWQKKRKGIFSSCQVKTFFPTLLCLLI